MGIANIINTAGGGGGGGSEIITNLVNSVDGAGLRLANQGYISCADVSANRFGTNDFSVEFVLSQETSAINADIFISNLNGSNQAVDAAVIRWDVIQNDNIQLVFTNSGATETAYNFGYDPAPDLNEPTHYLVSADRSGNAVLYRNGAEIASVSIAASSSANVGNSGQPTVIGSPVNNFGVKGNVYRLRTYSKALSSDEAKNVFDRADVPTALVSNLLLDLDCAYANPTQSTVIQDRGPNNQDGTLNGTITQTNVIKQGNLTSLAVHTAAVTPADGEVWADRITAANSGDTQSAELRNGELTLARGSSTPTYINFPNAGASLQLRGPSYATALTIDSTGDITQTATTPALIIKDTQDKSWAKNDALGSLQFHTADTSGVGAHEIAGIHTETDEAGTNTQVAGAMVFKTAAYNNATPSERMRITSDGDVYIRAANTSLTIGSTAANGSPSLKLCEQTASGDISNGFSFNVDGAGTNNLHIKRHVVSASGTDALVIDRDSGLCTFSGGIAFSQTNTSATGATATGTTLSHYESGTWTASLEFGGSTTGITYASNGNQGIYRRIGNMVYVSCIVSLSSKGSQTGSATIAGLPFIVSDEFAATSLENSLTSAYSNVGLAHAFAAGYEIQMRNASHSNLTDADFSNTASLRLAGWYTTP